MYHIVDSEIVRAMIQRESYGFKTFIAVRVGEIQEKTRKEDWFWVEGALNIADMVSRGIGAQQLSGKWQHGPSFLNEPEDKWPVQQNCKVEELPEQIVMHAKIDLQIDGGEESPLDLKRFSKYDKAVRVVARVIGVFDNSSPSLKNIKLPPTREKLQKAEKLLVQSSQSNLHEDIKPQTLARLGVSNKNGIVVVGSRFEDWTECSDIKENPILLSSRSKFAQLYAKKVHDESHLGISALTAKIRIKYWIVGIRRLLKSIRFRCVTCHRLAQKLQQQRMGPLPAYRLKPTPPWSYTSIDMFGPLKIRGEVNKRTQSKGYGVIFNCMHSRAIHLDVTTEYDTEAFLQVMRRFIAIRDSPIVIWSDVGSQLNAASKELKEAISNLNQEELKEFGSSHEIDWKFIPPDAPWQNGCSESLIKSVKKALKIAIGDQALTFSEMQTVLFEIANLVNSRPIGRHPTSVEDGSYLSPNDLLLGRSSKRIPAGPFNMTTDKYIRH